MKPGMPQQCRSFNCAWLTGSWDTRHRPDQTGAMFWQRELQIKGTWTLTWAVYVDHPTRWGLRQLEHVEPGMPVVLYFPNGRRMLRLPWQRDFNDI